jgi:hypothetical protein
MSTAITNLIITTQNIEQGILSDINSTGQMLNNYGILTKAYKKSFQSTETAVTTTPNSPAPNNGNLTESSSGADNLWTFTLNQDGWFRFVYAAAPFWNISTPYSQYDVAYDETNDSLYQATVAVTGGNTPATNSSFSLITDPRVLVDSAGTPTDPNNMIYQDFNTILYPNTSKKFGSAAAKAALENCFDCKRSTDVELYEFLKVLIDGMEVSKNRSEFIKGEKLARRADTL